MSGTEHLHEGKHRRISRRVIAEFHVAITYCNGTTDVLKHEGEDHLEKALEDYTALLAEAIEPAPVKPWIYPRHIRLLTLIGYDENARIAHHIDSGLFPCEHTGGGK